MASNQEKASSTESQILRSEEALKVKQRQIQAYIKDNYSKILDRQKEIQQVEAELMALQMEAKQTVNPRKQVLEFLRKKIEQQGERTSQAKTKELEAKKAYEHAVQVTRAEEEEKERLSKELQVLVQETASSQLERLEQLTRRLEILSGGAHTLLEPSTSEATKCLNLDIAEPSSSAQPDHQTEDNKQAKESAHGDSRVGHVSDRIAPSTALDLPQRVNLAFEQHAPCLTQPEAIRKNSLSNGPMTSTKRPIGTALVNLKGRGKGTLSITKTQGLVRNADHKNQWTGGGFDVQ